MYEIEIKLQVPAAQRGAVDAAVAGRGAAPRMRLRAAYFDSPDRALANAGLALRLRREGRRWVQTLKGATDHGLTRHEHNVARGGAAPMPPVDPALHAGTPVGDRLLGLLEQARTQRPVEASAASAASAASSAAPAGSLTELYRTDILRRARALRTPHGRVELAFDSGRIHAGESALDVLELEIESLSGTPRAVLETAARWLPRHGLWLDVRSKAERGDLLARGQPMAAPRTAVDPQLAPGSGTFAAWQVVLRSCSDQIIANASQIASGEHAPEHVHQLRVGLRRLRSALSLFEGLGADAALDAPATQLFRRLGSSRDRVVIADEFAAGLRAALRSAGFEGAAPLPVQARGEATPTEVLRDAATQALLLDLLAAALPDAAAAPASADAGSDAAADLTESIARRLNRWHRQLVADAKRFADLDDVHRHRLRKRAKRLRYAIEFCAALFERRALRRYLRSLRALQERLGAFSDAVMAMHAFARDLEAGQGDDLRAMFAIGWLAARREQLIAAARPELKAFVKVKRFWKKGG